jgi:hypothetical protein
VGEEEWSGEEGGVGSWYGEGEVAVMSAEFRLKFGVVSIVGRIPVKVWQGTSVF